jgi:hypothetical protein
VSRTIVEDGLFGLCLRVVMLHSVLTAAVSEVCSQVVVLCAVAAVLCDDMITCQRIHRHRCKV